MTQKRQSRDLLIFRCKYLENGLRQRLGTKYPLTGNKIQTRLLRGMYKNVQEIFLKQQI